MQGHRSASLSPAAKVRALLNQSSKSHWTQCPSTPEAGLSPGVMAVPGSAIPGIQGTAEQRTQLIPRGYPDLSPRIPPDCGCSISPYTAQPPRAQAGEKSLFEGIQALHPTGLGR